MEKDKTYDEYIKAYNQAYIIQKHMPDLAKEIADALKEDTLWADGFKDGREQMIKDKELNKPKFLRKDRLESFKANKDQIKDKDIDKDYSD